ncbi:MAG TPA: hypothetical protein PLU43_11340, partial [Lachnospiraceae bacterium]|nr:hypothetical protein [Lachnospiraceae bacterium]
MLSAIQKLFTTAVILTAAFLLSSCGTIENSSIGEPVSTVPEDTENLGTSATAQIPNPMVEITDASVFSDKLGITLDPDCLNENTTMYIIGERLAEIDYTVTNVEGEAVSCTLRAAKATEHWDNLCGVYDEMTETTEEYACNETSITVIHKTPKTEPVEIYEFTYQNIRYCFMYSGKLSNLLTNELINGVFCAIGAETV